VQTHHHVGLGQPDRPVGWNFKGLKILVLLALVGAALCVRPYASVGAVELTFLRTQGHDTVNEKGEKVLLRGVGLGNWMLPEGYMWKFGEQGDRPRRIEKLVSDLIGPDNAARFWSEFRQNYITEADIRRIAELGFNSVRPALNARLFLTETEPPQPVAEGFQLLDNLVKWCKAAGLYVIIDMHGAPGGQTGQNIDDSAEDQPGLFMQTKYQDQLVDLWVAIARRYANEPAVAGYDLLNEPLPERTGAAAKYKHLVEPLYHRLTRAIRAVDTRHMIILEGVDWANDWSIFTKPFDTNLVYQFHYYCWDTPSSVKSIKRYLDYRERLHAPVWVGETGERDNAIYWATTEYFEANNIGWSFWPWKKMDTSNTPYSINRPADWEAVAAYSRGDAKPPREIAQRALDELLVNIRLPNCVYFPDVVNAMLRRAPVRIEAENFAQDGPGVAFSVKNNSSRSRFYRLDQPVPISVRETQRRRSDQFITLSADEWTAYRVEQDADGPATITLQVRAVQAPAEVQLRVNDQTVDVTISEKSWTAIKLKPVRLKRGINQFKWVIQRGAVDLDWLDVRLGAGTQQALGAAPTTAAN
jgi:endoglucanase